MANVERYFLQLHKTSSRGEHFDFHLSVGEKENLHTWLMPYGPSMSSSDNRLAIYTGNKIPYILGDYEGCVLENEGKGEVSLIDRGRWWRVEKKDQELSLKDYMQKVIDEGKFHIYLNGTAEKGIRGSFFLYPFRDNYLMRKRDDINDIKTEKGHFKISKERYEPKKDAEYIKHIREQEEAIKKFHFCGKPLNVENDKQIISSLKPNFTLQEISFKKLAKNFVQPSLFGNYPKK